MQADLSRILFTREQIQQRVRSMADEIAGVYADLEPGMTIVPILSGSVIFLADLIRELPLRMKIALIQLSTYPGASTTAQQPQVVRELSGDVRGRHVLIVDDILDTGRTLRHVQQLIRERGADSVRTAVLLRKPGKAPPDVRVDFVGFEIDDLFVVGYGLDYDDHYRNLPHIGVLRPELTK